MIQCIFIRRKLYDYMENSLSQAASVKVKRHLECCAVCREKLEAMAQLIQAVEQKTAPQPSEEFWEGFKAGLHQKLNARLSPSLRQPLLDLKPKLSLRPAYGFLAFLVIVLGISVYLRYNNLLYFNASDTAIINEVSLLEELNPDISIGNGGNANIDELNILYRLGIELNIS